MGLLGLGASADTVVSARRRHSLVASASCSSPCRPRQSLRLKVAWNPFPFSNSLRGRHAVARAQPGREPRQASPAKSEPLHCHDDGETRTVNIAIASNIFIFIAKLYVSSTSGSSSLLSEAVHTAADIGNQVLLRMGIARSGKAPTSEYPYGYLKEKFVFSLISAVGVFCVGAGASLINGAYALTDHDHDVDNFGLNFIVLAVSFVVEGFSCLVAVRTISAGAESRGVSFFEHLDSAADPAAVAVMAEDGAAVFGVTIAAAATGLVKLTGVQAWDGIGSILVGILLAFVALFLIQRNRAVLIGRSMNSEDFGRVVEFLLSDPVVNHVYDARSEEIGPGVYRFSADLDFHGDVIVSRYLDTIDAIALQDKFIRTQNPADETDTRAFGIVLKEHGAHIVQAVGAEVDRMEAEIRNLVPGVRYVDLEADRGRFWQYRASMDEGDASGRGMFDMSQLSLDSVAWAQERDRLDYLLADGGASSGEEGNGVRGLGLRSMVSRSGDSDSSGDDENGGAHVATGVPQFSASMSVDIASGGGNVGSGVLGCAPLAANSHCSKRSNVSNGASNVSGLASKERGGASRAKIAHMSRECVAEGHVNDDET
jgi:solute carrier family 30 (zinc transporter), member 9